MIDFETDLTSDGIAIVRIGGWLEESSSRYFFSCIEDLMSDGYSNIVIDCQNLEQISSSFIGGLMNARGHARKGGGQIVMAGANVSIKSAVGFLGLKRFFGIYSTLHQALAKIRRKTTRHSENPFLLDAVS